MLAMEYSLHKCRTRTRLLLHPALLHCSLGWLKRLAAVGHTCDRKMEKMRRRGYFVTIASARVRRGRTFNHGRKKLKFVVSLLLLQLLVQSLQRVNAFARIQSTASTSNKMIMVAIAHHVPRHCTTLPFGVFGSAMGDWAAGTITGDGVSLKKFHQQIISRSNNQRNEHLLASSSSSSSSSSSAS
jgi:hypothetical protein